ncbi:hypothetical protein [Alistipes putredinis]|uniref:hypothetical protein n=1 Tax=Alistipes putredinis TaxID=28117 RepID=UPI003AB1EE33
MALKAFHPFFPIIEKTASFYAPYLKLRIMGDIIEKSSNDKWIKVQCHEHGAEMIDILETACRTLD